MKRVLNFRVVEGDPNEVDKNEILLVRDNSTGKVKSWTEDLSVDGSKTSLLTLGTNILGSIISSSLVNFFIFSKIYAPFDVINYNDDEGTNRYSKVKAIRIQKAYIPTDSES